MKTSKRARRGTDELKHLLVQIMSELAWAGA
jgi:hypothetical protein